MQTIPGAPPTQRDVVLDELHGHRIEDPYRWLEHAASDETAAWVEQQNAYTRSLLDAVPDRAAIHQRLSQLLSIGLVSAPQVRNGRYFYVRREGRQNQPVLYFRERLDGEERVLLDPNTASAEGVTVLDWWYLSRDGRLLAFGCSQNGDERSTLQVLDVDRGELRSERIPNTRYSSVAWLPDTSGFFYTRYPAPGTVPAGEENYNVRFFFHTLGNEADRDPEVHVTNLEREDMPWLSISPDGRYLTAGVHKGWERSDLFVRDLRQPNSGFVPVAVGFDAHFSGTVVDDLLYIHTDLEARRYRLFRVTAANPGRDGWEEIIAESPDAVLESFALVGGRIVAGYLHQATSSIRIFEANGTHRRDLALPALGTATAVTGEWEQPDGFFTFESFTLPPTVYRFSLDTGATSVWASVDARLDSDDFTVTQEWFTSRDGTPVSIFLVHGANLDRSQPLPTLLSGYGGFNISRTPLFSRSMYLWLEQGGMYALPNLRGGGEYGEAWHRAGMLEQKQNVFDDFIGAAEYLIDQGYTDSAHLAIQGGSNGGLLVGAALTQRPDLFRAVVCAVPLLDMLRYHHFLIARLWIPEYGSADDPVQFPFLHAYSPYHHVQPDTAYPAVLLTTAESDSRVDPLHARKMAALLQASSTSHHPILLRVETRAGHGIGKPLSKVIEEQTDMWAFLFWQLGVTIQPQTTRLES
ncbi:MAG: prolyl oligopeptidase family serine peptidase [Chloroflexota bacterium]|nr:prolyl oligopeptidase family serine peptidase [Chloroflexota bacterium]